MNEVATNWYDLCSKYARLFPFECNVSIHGWSEVLLKRIMTSGIESALTTAIRINVTAPKMIVKYKHGNTQYMHRIAVKEK